MILDHPTKFAHFLLDQAIRPGDVVIDATVGHGDDTLFLAERVADFGQVLRFRNSKRSHRNLRGSSYKSKPSKPSKPGYFA